MFFFVGTFAQVEAGDLVTFPDGMTCVTWWDGFFQLEELASLVCFICVFF